MALEFASRKATFPNYRKFETTFAGRPFVVETGKLCGLANGSAMIRYGETCVLCNVTMSEKPREGVDFFPLSVEFEEKMYSVGKIPGGFNKREGKASENSILTARVIDRPMRPLFPKDYRNDVTLNNMVMSVDPECRPELVAMIGAALSTTISDIPIIFMDMEIETEIGSTIPIQNTSFISPTVITTNQKLFSILFCLPSCAGRQCVMGNRIQKVRTGSPDQCHPGQHIY